MVAEIPADVNLLSRKNTKEDSYVRPNEHNANSVGYAEMLGRRGIDGTLGGDRRRRPNAVDRVSGIRLGFRRS
jgi:hypothetical protein